ncbi:hypothetical protein VTH82DRAFT_7987 [Thermothelomyces myriococcoides]
MSSQDDATPWEEPPPLCPSPSSPPPSSSSEPTTTTTTTLLGRSFFSRLGIVRRKPSRADAPPSLSKSCSDKLALHQCTSLLCSLASLFVCPRGVYLASLVLPASQHSPAACRRCFSADPPDGRMASLDAERPAWRDAGYGFHPFWVQVTEKEFEFSRRGIRAKGTAGAAGGGRGEEIKVVASNLAVAWTAGGEVEEGLIGGVLQGRKGFDPKGASLTSRRKMWAAAVEVASTLGDKTILGGLAMGSYDEVKGGHLLEGRRRVKDQVRGEVLKGWLRNTGDEDFSL